LRDYLAYCEEYDTRVTSGVLLASPIIQSEEQEVMQKRRMVHCLAVALLVAATVAGGKPLRVRRDRLIRNPVVYFPHERERRFKGAVGVHAVGRSLP
jgi:hypothetical protein